MATSLPFARARSGALRPASETTQVRAAFAGAVSVRFRRGRGAAKCALGAAAGLNFDAHEGTLFRGTKAR